MASGRCMNKLVELLVEAVVKGAAQVDDVRSTQRTSANRATLLAASGRRRLL
jgi:hypothetical protein